MRMMLIVLVLSLAMFGCHGAEPDHLQPRVTLNCAPCDGHGNVVSINTVEPVPLAVINTWHLCFDSKHPDICWHDCPKDCEGRGDEVCE